MTRLRRFRSLLRAAAGVTALALVAAGCGAGADDPLVSEDPTAVEPPPAGDTDPADRPNDGRDGAPDSDGAADTDGPAGDVPAVLAFSAPTLDGGTLEGAELAGRPVVFWFWSPH